jgi:CheY-like chemotaxis protein
MYGLASRASRSIAAGLDSKLQDTTAPGPALSQRWHLSSGDVIPPGRNAPGLPWRALTTFWPTAARRRRELAPIGVLPALRSMRTSVPDHPNCTDFGSGLMGSTASIGTGRSSMTISHGVVGVVDDDPGIRKAMANLLSALGYRPELFASAAEFLGAATRSAADCLVVDVQLGDGCGLELARRLEAAGDRRPIIFMTALDEEAVQGQAMALGCVAFLRKPFPSDLLIKAIARAVGGAHARVAATALSGI